MYVSVCSCIVCKLEFSVKGIHTHYLHKHTTIEVKSNTGKGTTKFLLRCCDIVTRKETTVQTLFRNLTIVPKQHIVKSCPKCGIRHTLPGTFCSRKCANSKKHSNETKLKISESLNSIVRTPRTPKYKRIVCSGCALEFNSYGRVTCSDSCLHQSFVNAGIRSANKLIRRSKDEIALYDLCIKWFSNVTHNDTSITGSWDADILIHEHKVAVLWNGPWHYMQMPHKNHSLAQVTIRDRLKVNAFESVGWKVLVFEDRTHTPQSAFDVIKLHCN